MIRKDLACAKSLRDDGESRCRSYSSQKKYILSYKVKQNRLTLKRGEPVFCRNVAEEAGLS